MHYQDHLSQFWAQYQTEVPAVKKIYELFLQRGEAITYLDHDHLALRTFNDPRVSIDVMMQAFIEAGYQESEMTYDFPSKHLFAKHYEPPQPNAPKIFISELLLENFSDALQRIVKDTIDQIPANLLTNSAALIHSGVSWQPLSYANYETLLKESQYAAWLYAYGFRANHFAFSVNNLKTFASCEEINTFLKQQGFHINQENGEVKGTEKDLLEQSSIMAQTQSVSFKEGEYPIPSCYYEFTKRFPDASGKLYPGFIPASADKLFESTNK